MQRFYHTCCFTASLITKPSLSPVLDEASLPSLPCLQFLMRQGRHRNEATLVSCQRLSLKMFFLPPDHIFGKFSSIREGDSGSQASASKEAPQGNTENGTHQNAAVSELHVCNLCIVCVCVCIWCFCTKEFSRWIYIP